MPNSEAKPHLLALETSGDLCGIALFRGEQLLVEYNFRHEMHLSERLLDIVDYLLKQFDLSLKEIDLYAVGIGPGSFTGTRMGVMTAKMFAYLEQKPLFGVDSLTALATEMRGLAGQVLFPILSCRKETIYTAPFRQTEKFAEASLPTATYSLEELVALILAQSENSVALCGEGATRHKEYLAPLLEQSGKQVSLLEFELPRAVIIGRVAARRFREGDLGDDVLELVPEYIAPPPISQPKKSFSLVKPNV